MAAAVVANIPNFTEAEAVEAYESFGIQDMGNGWYRCHLTFTEHGEGQMFSTYAKAGDSSHMQLSYGRVRAWFDLETGTIGEVSVSDEYTKPRIEGRGSVWGTQLEGLGNDPTKYRTAPYVPTD